MRTDSLRSAVASDFDGDRSGGDRIPDFSGGDLGGESSCGERGHEPGRGPYILQTSISVRRAPKGSNIIEDLTSLPGDTDGAARAAITGSGQALLSSHSSSQKSRCTTSNASASRSPNVGPATAAIWTVDQAPASHRARPTACAWARQVRAMLTASGIRRTTCIWREFMLSGDACGFRNPSGAICPPRA
jgi:hypothetical protein